MKIAVYYGGRGVIEDSTIYVVNKLTEVFQELNVQVRRYNLYEQKNEITALSGTIKEVDGVVLAVPLEWYGIGGYMQQFLDACWLYADKKKLQNMYMLPVVVAVTSGERQSELALRSSWELLGGKVADGICTFVENQVEFETNTNYAKIIEEKAENFYRTISRKELQLPTGYSLIKQSIAAAPIPFTPQESEDLSKYVSNDKYVKRQKEDIEELSQMFKGMLEKSTAGMDPKMEFIASLRTNYHAPEEKTTVSYALHFNDNGRTLFIEIKDSRLFCSYTEDTIQADVNARLTRTVMESIVNGRVTFQGAFMSGDISAKGDFRLLRQFDMMFRFQTLV
ncbi:MAG: NAD(P)H-dependent oxidoreductase [Lachnospiraceae bacterium]|nr:NAD(P)H-dependent oxidoreductase [Lachnospiraceae bacterium]